VQEKWWMFKEKNENSPYPSALVFAFCALLAVGIVTSNFISINLVATAPVSDSGVYIRSNIQIDRCCFEIAISASWG
jgi:hypothetical protein